MTPPAGKLSVQDKIAEPVPVAPSASGWREIQVNDIVQIDPAHDEVFGACYMLVTEVREWGYIGFVKVPGKGDQGGDAYYRVPRENCARVGSAEWVQAPCADADTGEPR